MIFCMKSSINMSVEITIVDEVNEFIGELYSQLNSLEYAIPSLTPNAFYENIYNIAYAFISGLYSDPSDEFVNESITIITNFVLENYCITDDRKHTLDLINMVYYIMAEYINEPLSD